MLKSEGMSFVRIAASLSHQREVVSELHSMRLLHISDHRKSPHLDIGAPMRQSAALSQLLLQCRSLLSLLGVERPDVRKPLKLGLRDVSGLLREAERRSKPLKFELSGRMAELERKKAILESLAAAGVEPSFLEIRSLKFALAVSKKRLARGVLHGVTDRAEVFAAPFGQGFLHAVFFDREQVVDRLKSLRAEVMDSGFLQEYAAYGSFSEAAGSLAAEIAKLGKSLAAQQRIRQMLARRYGDALLHAEQLLSQEAEKAEAPLRFAVTKHAFMATGWVPSAKLLFLKERLESRLRNKVSVELLQTKESPPTKFRHPAPVRPFQFFLNLYSIPRYDEIDPSHLMALSFPLFFGFMLGDIGYGLVTLSLFLLLRQRIRWGEGRKLVNALILSSLATIAFGFVFGEFFGEEEVLGFHLPHLLSRVEQISELMVVAILIGVVHVNLGLLVGFFNVLQAHGLKNAVFEKASWVLLQLGAYALYTSSGSGLLLFLGAALVLAAAAMLVASEGLIALIEIPNIFTNILSYARLMALGLASVSLAVLVNDLAFEMFRGGALGVIAGVAVLVIGQAINVALGIIGPFLHSLRLHYVEFFGKFYKGGGKPYLPFGGNYNNSQ